VGLVLLSRILAVPSESLRRQEGRLPPATPPFDRRVTDKAYPLATLIGPGARVRGDVHSDHPVEVRGTLEGDCCTSARCVVHEGGRVLGNIDAIALVVAGEVDAGLLQAEKVELRASARVSGVIRAGVVAIADGAFYEGEIEIPEGASSPPVLKDRRRPGRGSTEP
jgi:cytoskeletal protein CcmA (bactofilin family)